MLHVEHGEVSMLSYIAPDKDPLFCELPPSEWLPKFSVLQVCNYRNKKGVSVLWIEDKGSSDIDIHGRAMFTIARHYGAWQIDVFFIRIIIG